MRSELSTWRTTDKKAAHKIQIDLVIDRADRVVTLVECKYSEQGRHYTPGEISQFSKRQAIFIDQIKTKKFVNSVLVSSTPPTATVPLKQAFYQLVSVEDIIRAG